MNANLQAIQYVYDFIIVFTSIFYEAMPFIVLGAVLAGVLEEFIPQSLITRILPRSRTLAVALGGLIGLVFPMCECGIIPVMRRLIRKGLPLSCCVAYLLAGPIINVVVMTSTYVAFTNTQGKEAKIQTVDQVTPLGMVGLRVVLGYIVAVTTALIVDRAYAKHGNKLLTPLTQPPPEPAEKDDAIGAKKILIWILLLLCGWIPILLIVNSVRAFFVSPKKASKRLANISETALHDFVDISVYLCLGALLAATVRIWLTPQAIEDLSRSQPIVTILIMMAIAILLCLCSEADAFVAASFRTMAPSAKVAFLVLGPMMDFKLFAMYTRVFRPRLIWTIIISVIIQVFVYSVALHLVFAYTDWLDFMLS